MSKAKFMIALTDEKDDPDHINEVIAGDMSFQCGLSRLTDDIESMISRTVSQINGWLNDMAKNLGVERNRQLVRFPGATVMISWDVKLKVKKSFEADFFCSITSLAGEQ